MDSPTIFSPRVSNQPEAKRRQVKRSRSSSMPETIQTAPSKVATAAGGGAPHAQAVQAVVEAGNDPAVPLEGGDGRALAVGEEVETADHQAALVDVVLPVADAAPEVGAGKWRRQPVDDVRALAL